MKKTFAILGIAVLVVIASYGFINGKNNKNVANEAVQEVPTVNGGTIALIAEELALTPSSGEKKMAIDDIKQSIKDVGFQAEDVKEVK